MSVTIVDADGGLTGTHVSNGKCLQRIGDLGLVLQLSLNGVKTVVVHSAQDSVALK